MLYHKAMQMQAKYIAENGRMPLEMGVFTSNHYVIVNNLGEGNISAIRAFNIEKNREEIENEIISLTRRYTDEGLTGWRDSFSDSVKSALGVDSWSRISSMGRQDADGSVRGMVEGNRPKRGADNALAGGTHLNPNDSSDDIRYHLREKAAPKNSRKVYKLMRLGADGKLYPLFIDAAEPVELGNWYDADSPNLDMLRKLESGIWMICIRELRL